MQAFERRSEIEVKRGMDTVRDLLLSLESNEALDGHNDLCPDGAADFGIENVTYEELAYHLTLLIEARLVRGVCSYNTMPVIQRLTWEGHEFLDNVRDPTVWSSTKHRLREFSSVALSVVADVAKAEIKKKLGIV